MKRTDIDQAANALAKIVEQVHDGTLTATSPQEVAAVRRIEGAIIALRSSYL